MAETILFRFNCGINGQEGLKVESFRNCNKSRKIEKKIEPEKGGLITLDDDLKVNSQKSEPGKKQIWTIDPQDFFKLHRIAPHRHNHNENPTLCSYHKSLPYKLVT